MWEYTNVEGVSRGPEPAVGLPNSRIFQTMETGKQRAADIPRPSLRKNGIPFFLNDGN